MTQTTSDLGKAVKAKYPGSYDDMADDAVGRAVKAKYPGSYDDYTDDPVTPTTQPAQPRSTIDTALQYSGLSGLGQMAMGGIKGLGETAATVINRLGVKPGTTMPTPGLWGGGFTMPDRQGIAAAAQPSSPLESIGKGIERSAEFALPAAKVGALTSGAPALARMGAQGLTGAGVGLAQGQDAGTAALSGTLAAGGEAVNMAWPAVKDFVTRKVTPRAMNALMGVKPQMLGMGADPGGRVIKEGIVASSKDDLIAKIGEKLKPAGQALELELGKHSDKFVDANDLVITALDNAGKRIGLGSDEAFQNRLQIVLSDILKRAGGSLDKMTPLQLQKLKSEVGDAIKWTGTPFEGDVNQALVEIYRNLNNATETLVPGAKNLLRRWGDLKVAENALRNEITQDMTRPLMSGQSVLSNALKLVGGTPGITGTSQLIQQLMNPARGYDANVIRGLIGAGQSSLTTNPTRP